MDIFCCECRVLSGRGLCDELITLPEESYRLCCVVVCDLETSRICAPYIYDIRSLRVNDLTIIPLTWRKWWANNASKQQMGFNSGFKGLISASFCERIDSEEVSKGCGIRWSIPMDVLCCLYCVIPTGQWGFLSFYDQCWSIQCGYLTVFYMHTPSSLCPCVTSWMFQEQPLSPVIPSVFCTLINKRKFFWCTTGKVWHKAVS